jgi:hypothetical protein
VLHKIVIFNAKVMAAFRQDCYTIPSQFYIILTKSGAVQRLIFFYPISIQDIKHSAEFVKQNIPCIVISDDFSVMRITAKQFNT